MKRWTLNGSPNLDGFKLGPVTPCDPAPGEATVRLKAASLNFRDLMIAQGIYPLPVSPNVVPLSDGCWEVVDVGEGVTRVKPGDRVVNNFARSWINGRLEPWMWSSGFGQELDGVLTQSRNIPAEVLVHVPDTISDIEAATLPCAAVTASHALFGSVLPLLPGQTALVLGTGGVSTFALQLAKAAGARVIVISSSNAKLDRAKALGADVGINYRDHPDWEEKVREATGGIGVDVVTEVGGPGTLAKSLAALRHGGRVALIGALSDPMAVINPGLILMANGHVHGVMVGSRAHTETLVQMIAVNGIKPVIDAVYPFEEAVDAFRYLESGRHFGKIVITG